MPFVILGLLLTGPLSLYDLHKRFRAGISLFYSASYGSLQRNLSALVAQGAVTVEDDPDNARGRKLHALTPAGRDRWREWMLAPIPEGADAETVMLSKAFLLGRLDAEDRPIVTDAIRTRAQETLAGLETLSIELDGAAASVPQEHHESFAYQRAVLDYGLRTSRLAVTWAADLETVAR